MKKCDVPKFLIIAPQFKPLPSNSGGVEGLITDLVNENEIQKKAHFIVVAKNQGISDKTFNYTSFIYSEDKSGKSKIFKKYLFPYRLFCIFRKITHNKIINRLFERKESGNYDDYYFGYYCNKLALKVKPDAILLFGYDKIHHFWYLSNNYGNQNVYYYIHYCRSENLQLREMFPNTIAVSRYVFNKWNKTHLPNERSAVISNAIDFRKFNYNFSKEIIRNKRKELGFKDNDFVVIFVGRFRPGKGIIELLTAFEYIKMSNIKLLMLGDFDRKSDDEVEYENCAKNKINNDERIHHLGFVPNDQLPLYYACSNAQVVPTVYEEAAGLVAIEGMLAGLPLIVTKSGGLPEYVDDECSFKLEIDKNLSKNIASSIIELYKNPALCRKMCDNSKLCAAKYRIDSYYNNLLSFLIKH